MKRENRTNELLFRLHQGAFWGLIGGLIIGLIRFIWEFSYAVPPCELSHTDQRPGAVKFHFLYFAILLFVLTCLIAVTISLLTRPIPEQCVREIVC
jgi:Na+/proline symporter